MSHYPQDGQRKAVTGPALLAMRQAGRKIAALTCYYASFATLMNQCGVDLLLVGDSLGKVVQGRGTTQRARRCCCSKRFPPRGARK